MSNKKKLIIILGISLIIVIAVVLAIVLSKDNEEITETSNSNRQQTEAQQPQQVEENTDSDNPILLPNLAEPGKDSAYFEEDEESKTLGKENVYISYMNEELSSELKDLTSGYFYPDYDMWLYDLYHTLYEYRNDANIKDITSVDSISIYVNSTNKKLFYVLSDKNGNVDIVTCKFMLKDGTVDTYTYFLTAVNEYTNYVYTEIVGNYTKLGEFSGESSVITYAWKRYYSKETFNVLSKALKENLGPNEEDHNFG